MVPSSFPARLFLILGLALAVIGLVLWFVLPIRMKLPPYLPTSVVAVLYGIFCLWQNRVGGRGKPKA